MIEKKYLKIIGITVAVVVAVIALGVLIYFLTRPSYALKATFVNKEPDLNGKGDDGVWQEAEEVVIPVENGNEVTLKAIYTKEKLFFLAKFKDKTKDYIDEPWSYDGKKWTRGRSSDQFALFFEIDDSIVDFDKKGFEVMTFGFKPQLKIWEFGIKGPRTKRSPWKGYNQRADVWMMHSSISSPFDKGDDGYFAVSRDYLMSPTTQEPVIWVQWDAFDNPGILALNTTIWREAQKASAGLPAEPIDEEEPVFMYQDGLNMSNTPYPFEDQMVEITDYSSFEKGDEIPWVMFNREFNGSWGGSRADIDGKMTWSDDEWTVEMGRKLNTDHPDDLAFDRTSEEPIYFGVLVRFDGRTIRYSVPVKIEFVQPGGEE